jgi:hypothetical protein
MKDLKKTDTFFDRSGEIVCVTRVEQETIFGGNAGTIYYGVYCTGPKSKHTFDASYYPLADLEHRFSPRQVLMSYPREPGHVVNRSVTQAFAEAIYGKHPAHVTTKKGTRTASVRTTEAGRFDLTLSAYKLDFKRNVYALTERQAKHMVYWFIHGKVVSLDRPWYSPWINQAVREADIDLDTLGATRVRISYEMPNTGTNGAWRKVTQVDNYLFIQE